MKEKFILVHIFSPWLVRFKAKTAWWKDLAWKESAHILVVRKYRDKGEAGEEDTVHPSRTHLLTALLATDLISG